MKSPVRKRFPLDTNQYTLRLSRHAERMAAEKNFSMQIIQDTFYRPMRVYPSGSHPGQYRITGNGLCLVGLPEEADAIQDAVVPKKDEFRMITIDDTNFPVPIPENPATTTITKATRTEKRKPFFTIITIYQDMVLTPPRGDQLETPEGKRYAERYLKGLGRG